jgi:hypothetical protein
MLGCHLQPLVQTPALPAQQFLKPIDWCRVDHAGGWEYHGITSK